MSIFGTTSSGCCSTTADTGAHPTTNKQSNADNHIAMTLCERRKIEKFTDILFTCRPGLDYMD
ncbi:hypothetical protein VHA_000502 [Grimontia hollisae CIP 101886]|uniref:Uncharacterized protein n=1 Tax=Grimontia hollisae CIP 101886 TaxID=675812 RepID=D0I437_GRIHO|nr:hypothetical protein VHA_000502 [Grimontia hollisae CIP 101886]